MELELPDFLYGQGGGGGALSKWNQIFFFFSKLGRGGGVLHEFVLFQDLLCENSGHCFICMPYILNAIFCTLYIIWERLHTVIHIGFFSHCTPFSY